MFPISRRPRKVSRHRIHGQSSIWGFADQAVISGTNFVTMVLLARGLGPSAFGVFSLAYISLLFANSLQFALITQPHNVLGASRHGAAYVSYTSAVAIAQLLISGALAGAAVVGGVTARMAGSHASGVFFVLAGTVLAWQLQEFTRRVLYTKGHVFDAFANDVLSYGAQTLAIAVLWRTDQLTSTTAFGTMALSSAAAFAVGLYQIKSDLRWPVSRSETRGAVSANWTFGRWLTGSTLLHWASGELYPILTAGFVGVAATGAMRAVQTIMGPTHVLLRGMDAVFTPRAAAAFAAGGGPALERFIRGTFAKSAVFMGGYCLAVILFARPLLRRLYGDQYVDNRWLLITMSFVYALFYLQVPAGIALRATERTAPVFQAYLISAIVALTAGVMAVRLGGLAGAALGLLVHMALLNVLLWWHYHRALRAFAADVPSYPGLDQTKRPHDERLFPRRQSR